MILATGVMVVLLSERDALWCSKSRRLPARRRSGIEGKATVFLHDL